MYPVCCQFAIDLGTDRTAIEVTAGGNHTCARLDNDDVKVLHDSSWMP